MKVNGLGGGVGKKDGGKRGSWNSLFQLRVIHNQSESFATKRDKERVRADVCEDGETPLGHFGPGIICMIAE